MSDPEYGSESSGASRKSESFEEQSHLVTPYEFDVDLTKPDRADEYLMELATGMQQSKLVGEIESLGDRISIIYIDHQNAGSYALLLSTVTGARELINPGTVAIIDEDGGCNVKFDQDGKRITVYSEHPEASQRLYVLHADEVPISRYQAVPQYEVPAYEEYVDDQDV